MLFIFNIYRKINIKMTAVTGLITQNTAVNFYCNPNNDCLCGHPPSYNNCNLTSNGTRDWNYSAKDPNLYTIACSNGAPCVTGFGCYSHWCSPADFCPVLFSGGGGLQGLWVSDTDANNTLSEGRTMECQYNVSNFKDYRDIDVWINKFGTTGPNGDAFNTIMTSFCAQLAPEGTCISFTNLPAGSTACPAGLTGCSMFSSNSPGGDQCRNWAQSAPGIYSAGYYRAGSNFCNSNECAIDCLCYNRDTVDPIYEAIQGPSGTNVSVPDVCWYIPCKNAPEKYLQPSTQSSNVNSCPPFCAQIVTIVNSQGIIINEENNTIQCPFGTTGATGTNPSNPSSLWDTMGVYAVIFGFVLLIVIIIIICIVIATYEKK